MKNRENNVLPFPKPPEEEPGTSMIICQIGRERFAIHMQVEDLPPASPPVVMVKRRARKAPADREIAPETTCGWKRNSFLGSLFDDWQVCWLGGWSKHRMYYLVMLTRTAR